MNKNTFGIHMPSYCRAHERYIESQLAAGTPPEELENWHFRKIAWLQHERLIHLLVTLLTAAAFLFAAGLGVFLDWPPGTGILSALLFVLLSAYLLHYFRLENTVQRWYRIAEQLHGTGDGSA